MYRVLRYNGVASVKQVPGEIDDRIELFCNMDFGIAHAAVFDHHLLYCKA